MSDAGAKYASADEAGSAPDAPAPLQLPPKAPSPVTVVADATATAASTSSSASIAAVSGSAPASAKTSRSATPTLNLGGVAPSADRAGSVPPSATGASAAAASAGLAVTPEEVVRLKNEVFERSVTIHQLKQRVLDLEKVSSGAGTAPNSARVQLEGVQLKLVNANNQVDGLRAELQRVIKQRDAQMEKADADAKLLQEQIAALVERATQMVDKSMLENVRCREGVCFAAL